jgi:hypothetical protein
MSVSPPACVSRVHSTTELAVGEPEATPSAKRGSSAARAWRTNIGTARLAASRC